MAGLEDTRAEYQRLQELTLEVDRQELHELGEEITFLLDNDRLHEAIALNNRARLLLHRLLHLESAS